LKVKQKREGEKVGQKKRKRVEKAGIQPPKNAKESLFKEGFTHAEVSCVKKGRKEKNWKIGEKGRMIWKQPKTRGQ